MDRSLYWQEELEILNSIIQKTELIEMTKWGAPVYTYNGNNVVAIGGFKNHFAIWFYNGVFLADEKKVLVNAQEGKTKSQRQWRFTAMDQIDEKLILTYIQEALENEKQGKKLKPQPKEQLSVPTLFITAFKKNKTFRENFESLTPGKKNEYIEYIVSAKQEATQQNRMEKIIPLILEGKGLNDKYKK